MLTVDGEQVSSIGPGILALIGVCQDDTPEHADWLIGKIVGLKMWPEVAGTASEARPWRANVADIGGDILCGVCSADSFAIHALRQDSQRYKA